MMSAAHQAAKARDVSPIVDATNSAIREALARSVIWRRMTDGTLSFAGRAAFLEQHWEGLRVLRTGLEGLGGSGDTVTAALARNAELLGSALDSAHATARWRDHHVTMPAMLQFRRRVNEMAAGKDAIGLHAHAVVRLAAVAACPVAHEMAQIDPRRDITCVLSTEDEEHFAEEISNATLLVLAQGADVCRAYQGVNRASSCAITAAAIRRALSQSGEAQ
ncbi:hypothetical protein CHEID_03825 [Corynebacterium heidelbergense]|uniref:Uncharacterized protein n=2 Tax=Corynebacterium heidelbergense TaxID=2055947 RepID=A0A364VD48_9CORY|nr:hypothetical protein [Corynebacterium heidelbergense]RAV34554.1 hypothetical protein CWC39_02520 [Corynebacterium heidelbergense]WCZ36316.1 hypothetical protein CHEID_03825 [Corynebacterium heidelbergense]